MRNTQRHALPHHQRRQLRRHRQGGHRDRLDGRGRRPLVLGPVPRVEVDGCGIDAELTPDIDNLHVIVLVEEAVICALTQILFFLPQGERAVRGGLEAEAGNRRGVGHVKGQCRSIPLARDCNVRDDGRGRVHREAVAGLLSH